MSEILRACDRWHVAAQWDAGERADHRPCKVVIVHYTAETPMPVPAQGWRACRGLATELTTTHGTYRLLVNVTAKETGIRPGLPRPPAPDVERFYRVFAEKLMALDIPLAHRPAQL